MGENPGELTLREGDIITLISTVCVCAAVCYLPIIRRHVLIGACAVVGVVHPHVEAYLCIVLA